MATDSKKIRRDIARRFERTYNPRDFDIKEKSRQGRGKALIFGLLTAGILYMLANMAANYGFQRNLIEAENYAKLIWISMIPCTVLGLLVWLISKNRYEYPVRQEIRSLIEGIEGKEGFLWRFKPIWEHYDGETTTFKKALVWSEEKKIDKLDLEDYCDTVAELRKLLAFSEQDKIPTNVLEAVASNF